MAPRRAGDTPVLVADPSAAQEILGWRPAITDIDRIVESAWRWHSRERG
jgi:UDP-glucose 4-epimerase